MSCHPERSLAKSKDLAQPCMGGLGSDPSFPQDDKVGDGAVGGIGA